MVTSSAVVGLVGDEQARLAGRGHGDHDALAHAAGKLVGVVILVAGDIGDADSVEQFHHAPVDGCAAQIGVFDDGFGNLRADALHGIERNHGILEDHGDVVAAQIVEHAFGAPTVSVPKSLIEPRTARLSSSRPSMDMQVRLFPQPLSANRAQRFARQHRKAYLFHQCIASGVDAEARDFEKRRCGFGIRKRQGGGNRAASHWVGKRDHQLLKLRL
ncbi:hypothetical protein N8D56_06925 [Devosia sp. A8/3-2]|nr:hypothetical protein N8D56_06925 [Devosia sp. A8/3-2]